MKKIMVALVLSVAIAGFAQTNPSAKTAKPASTSTKAQPGQKVEDMMDSFKIMERGFWDAWKKKDAKPFEQHMAPNSLVIDNTGIADKAATLKGISQCEVKNYDLSDFKLTKIDNDNALLTYTASNVDAVCAGQRAPAKVFASTVFSKSGGKWWMLFHQESTAIANQPAQ